MKCANRKLTVVSKAKADYWRQLGCFSVELFEDVESFRTRVGSVERGGSNVRFINFVKIASELRIPVGRLLDGADR
jgi:hypothetical protein